MTPMGSNFGSGPGWPDFSGFITQCFGGPTYIGDSVYTWFAMASNIVIGQNPPYSVTDFYAYFPKYAGPAIVTPGTLDGVSNVVTQVNTNAGALAIGQYIAHAVSANPAIPGGTTIASVNTPAKTLAEVQNGSPNISVADTTGLYPCMAIAGDGIPRGTYVVSITGTGVTMSAAATADGVDVPVAFLPVAPAGILTLSNPSVLPGTFPLTIYTGPSVIPPVLLNSLIALASSSLVQARWCELWPLAMAWYVDHYATLMMQSGGDLGSTCGAAAAASLKQGILVAASAGGVSESLQPVPGLEQFGAWNMTSSGVLLATQAKSIGAGLSLVY